MIFIKESLQVAISFNGVNFYSSKDFTKQRISLTMFLWKSSNSTI
jgi:hypothetical protein